MHDYEKIQKSIFYQQTLFNTIYFKYRKQMFNIVQSRTGDVPRYRFSSSLTELNGCE